MSTRAHTDRSRALARGLHSSERLKFVLSCLQIFGLPLMMSLAFLLRWGVRGFWVGMAITCAVQGGVMTLVSLRLDWAAEANRARALVDLQALADMEAPASVKLEGDD